MIRLLMLILLSVASLHALAQGGERRVALVIGNNAYTKVPQLEKAVGDGKTIAAELKRAGYDVKLLTDAKRREMNDAINSFKDKIADGGVGVFYFAGHGVQVEGTNFLLPVDVDAGRVEDLDSEAISVPNMLDKIGKSKARFSLLVLDACRDNPFPKKAGRSIGGTRGLSLQQDTPKGLMVLYSAGANQQALDSLSPDDRNPNGLFTRELVKHMRDTNLRVDEMLRRVRISVAQKAEAVSHEQNPALYEQTTGDFYLYPASMRTGFAQSSGKLDPAETELVFWNSVKDSRDKADIQAYLEKYPKGQFADIARRRLKRIDEENQAPLAAAEPRASKPETGGNSQKSNKLFHEALHRGDIGMVNDYLNAGYNHHSRNEDDGTAIGSYIFLGAMDDKKAAIGTIKLFINKGFDPKAREIDFRGFSGMNFVETSIRACNATALEIAVDLGLSVEQERKALAAGKLFLTPATGPHKSRCTAAQKKIEQLLKKSA